jgi:hypothetical protein
LKSNLYIFVEGHIYYGNKVIKIRYDLIRDQKYLDENKIFNHYKKILPITNDNYHIQSGLPLQTCLYNRLVYIFTNPNQFPARRILILPFLHDRKIVLNRRILGEQFYTLYKCKQYKNNYILCLCVNYDKMYIYTETGILIDRIQYKQLANECGKPVTVSDNGLKMIFR